MSKQYLLQLVCLLFVFCGGSLTVAQELDLDEIDVFGDSAAADPAAPATQTDDVFSEGGDVFSEGGEASSSDDPMSKDPSQLTQEDLMALMNQGAALQEEAKWNDAIIVYSRILQNARFARYAPALFERAKCFQEVGELQLADAGFDEAAANSQVYPELLTATLTERGKLLMEMGSFEDALGLFSQAVASNASDPELLYLRGKAQLRVAQSGFGPPGDNVGMAIKSLKRAI
ncbi:MAG: hypothetical protein AAGF97_05475, partial [Planctomycetota bacterium]